MSTSTPNEIHCGQVLSTRDLEVPSTVFDKAAHFGSSCIEIREGQIVIETPGSANTATFSDLCKQPFNRPGDILIWASMTTLARSMYIKFIENAKVPDKDEARVAQDNVLKKHRVLMLTYLFHGSLHGITCSPPRLPRWALESFGLSASDMTLASLTHVPSFSKSKLFVPVLTNMFSRIPKTVLFRAKLAFPGNRLFAIAKMMKPTIKKLLKDEDAFLKRLFDETVLKNAPYVSFHPDHPANPMANSMKTILATLGSLWRSTGIQLDALFRRDPALFVPHVMHGMTMSPEDVPGCLPDVARFNAAVCDEYSIQLACHRA